MDPYHVHSQMLPSFDSKAQTVGTAIRDFVEGGSRNKLLVVGTRGMGAIKRCVRLSLVGDVSCCCRLWPGVSVPCADVFDNGSLSHAASVIAAWREKTDVWAI